MDLAAIAAKILTVAAQSSGLAEDRIAWVNSAGATEWTEFPNMELVSKGPQRARAWDWTEKVYDSGTGKLTKTQVGPREMKVTFRVESVNQDPGSSAEQYVSNIQTRLQRGSIQEALAASGLALATLSDLTIADYAIDDRMNSVAQIDVLFNLAESDVDDTDNGDWFNIVHLSSQKLKNPDGTDAATQIDLTVGPPT